MLGFLGIENLQNKFGGDILKIVDYFFCKRYALFLVLNVLIINFVYLNKTLAYMILNRVYTLLKGVLHYLKEKTMLALLFCTIIKLKQKRFEKTLEIWKKIPPTCVFNLRYFSTQHVYSGQHA